jgi:CubicO group peptidase (beta-lactamase class C family)
LENKALAGFDADIAAGKYGNIDSMLVVRYGKIAFDRVYQRNYDRVYRDEARKTGALNAQEFGGPYNYFNPWWHPYYRRGDLHTLQSVTKTISSAVIGVAVTRREFPSLDTPVLQYFSDRAIANVDDRKRRITIRHLLTMTPGLEWKELQVPYDHPENSCMAMERSADWVQYAIDRPMADEPGRQFNYNSGTTMLLAHIFGKATGHDIEEYAAKHLFRPLGIKQYFWKRTPTGLVDTEGGLYLQREDLAKILYLFSQKGAWEGTPILSPEWVQASLTPSIPVGTKSGIQYGFQWWLFPYAANDPRLAFVGQGLGGQLAIIIPEYDLVLVFTAWNVLTGPSLSTRVAIDRVVSAIKRPNQ